MGKPSAHPRDEASAPHGGDSPYGESENLLPHNTPRGHHRRIHMLSTETVIYVVNLVIGAILASLMTHHWQLAGRGKSMGYWMVAAWVMTGADILFAVRPEMPNWFGRFFPTLLVTVGQGVLLLGARHTAGREARSGLVTAVVALHAVLLAGFLLSGSSSPWRMVTNGIIWAGLSVASFLALRRAGEGDGGHFRIPAAVFLIHGVFHFLRVSTAAFLALSGRSGGTPWLQVMGDLEVSFFITALFVSLLISHLQLRNEELRRALTEVRELSGMLPICAWCRKVRDDSGYWQKIEEYFKARGQVRFTHGICDPCRDKNFGPVATRVK